MNPVGVDAGGDAELVGIFAHNRDLEYAAWIAVLLGTVLATLPPAVAKRQDRVVDPSTRIGYVRKIEKRTWNGMERPR